MANGVITYENPAKPLGTEEVSALGIPLTGDYYYSFLNSKVKLTELGIHILDSIKTNQAVGDKVPTAVDEYLLTMVHVTLLQSARRVWESHHIISLIVVITQ